MQTSSREQRIGGYSDFFSSGYVSSKQAPSSRARHSASYSLPSIPSDLIRSLSSHSRRRSVEGENKRPATPPQSPKLRNSSRAHVPSPLASAEKSKRRSSFMGFSSRLLDKMTPGVSEAQSFVDFDETRRKSRTFTRDEAAEWTKLGMSGPVVGTHVSSIRTLYPDSNERDPFSPSPKSKSFFIDLTDPSSSFTSPPKRSRHQSFISVSGAYLGSLTSSLTRRERPRSVHSLPSPSDSLPPDSGQTKSRCSSYSQPLIVDKADLSSLQDESVVSLSPHDNEDRDLLADIDWREFHVQLCDNV
ncbi:hypothetical protein C8R42DRAFT_715203 [Lentinula raphanica]|nr:hypothetical protein C8R42DRAFT_715203 [Lentinula raphanica]KAJ3753143.1 hypothetical protein EV360DRAFT_88058 [Lentinula raphanica]